MMRRRTPLVICFATISLLDQATDATSVASRPTASA